MKSLLLPFLFIPIVLFSQNTEIDSLRRVLLTQSEDLKKVKTLNNLANIYYRVGDQNNNINYSKQALRLAEKINYVPGQLDARGGLHQGYMQLSNFPRRLKIRMQQ
jgi:hypothetical protein